MRKTPISVFITVEQKIQFCKEFSERLHIQYVIGCKFQFRLKIAFSNSIIRFRSSESIIQAERMKLTE